MPPHVTQHLKPPHFKQPHLRQHHKQPTSQGTPQATSHTPPQTQSITELRALRHMED